MISYLPSGLQFSYTLAIHVFFDSCIEGYIFDITEQGLLTHISRGMSIIISHLRSYTKFLVK